MQDDTNLLNDGKMHDDGYPVPVSAEFWTNAGLWISAEFWTNAG